jgi:tRNA A-37 threonylcarbamoyl transferase component Bud32
MEELGSALGRFVGGLSDVDELRRVFRDYLRRNPQQRDAVARWLGEGVQMGRVAPAVMLTVRDLLGGPDAQMPTVATVAATRYEEATARPRPPLQRSPGPTGPTAPTAADGPLRIGTVLDNRYTLIEELGGGGMGTVYKARDRNREDFRDRHPFIALKVLGEDFKRHPDAIMALQRETVRAQNLAHPNIITVYDFDYDGPHAYMTMELLEGQPLDAVLLSESFAATPLLRRWQIVRSIGAGLAYAHEKGVVHSDLKPGNIFICRNGAVKVMDFGIARPLRAVADQSETTAFDPAERIGGLTPAYASLEQWNRDPPDPRDDIYAFACVVYFVFSGRHPFARASAKSAFEARMVPQRIESLSRRQWDALRRALALRRNDRLGSVEEFLRLFAPQTWLQKNRVWISAASAVAVVLLLVVAASTYRGYAQDQALNAMLWPAVASPLQPLNADQQHEVEDVLYLAGEALTQAKRARSPQDFSAIMSNGANNVHDMLMTVRMLDPANARALQLTDEAAQAYAQFARAQVDASKPADAYQLVLEGQKFQHTRELLRLRQDICRRSPSTCTAGD